MTTTRTGDSPSANTEEKAAALSKTTSRKAPELEGQASVVQDVSAESKEAQVREAEKLQAEGKELTYQQAQLLELPFTEKQERAYIKDVEAGRAEPPISAAKQAKREKNQPW